MKKTLKLAALLLVYSALFFACKKKTENAPFDPLKGTWVETPAQNYKRVVKFNDGGKFSMQMSNTADANYMLILNGTYTVQGENLIVKIKEQQEKQGNGQIVTTIVNQSDLFEKGTFSIINTVLTLTYTSYPADAPVRTQVKFNKVIAID